MGLIDFVKNAGHKLFNHDEETKVVEVEKKEALRASKLLQHVKDHHLPYLALEVKVKGFMVILNGKVESHEDAEKIAVTVGNVENVEKVENNLEVVNSAAKQATYHTVVKGDSLSKIAKVVYQDPMKYPIIFEANKPMLKDPDLIYPGQVLIIPAL